MRFAPPIGLALLLAVAAAAEDAPDRPPAPETRPAEPAARQPLFAVSAEEVRVDLVVRDKKGALVRGLTAGDVLVFEDGVRQDVRSVELIQAEPLIGADAEAPPPAYVAVVFDRLGPGARSFVREGLLTYLEAERHRRPHIGVFSIESGLKRLAPFTDDPAALRREADALLGSIPRSLADARERQDVLNAFTGMIEGIGQSYVAPAEMAGVPECRGAEADQVRQSEFLAARMAGMYQSLERDQQGQGTVNALLALVGALQELPGRKAVVLFSEGLIIPGVEKSLRSVVSAANRAGVSIYGADAGGLRAASETDETKRTLDSIRARLRQNVVMAPASAPATSTPAEGGLTLLERAEDALRLPASTGLSLLAEQTGGFLIEKTNALAPGIGTVVEDLREHYVVSYAPRNRDYDGRFRAIEVKVRRPHGRLQARKGYLAVRTSSPVPLLEHEARPYARLEEGPLPTAVALRLRGLHFPGDAALARVPVFVELEAAGLSVAKDKKAGRYRQDFTVLVLARDAQRRVVAKMSQRYALEGRLAELEADRRARILFSRETSLPPGAYTLEAIAYDNRTGEAGAATTAFEVPPATAGHLLASSLVVVDRAEARVPSGQPSGAPGDSPPLQYGDLLLYPNLGQPLRRGTEKALAFSVTALPTSERLAVDARVEILRDGKRVAAPPPTALRADQDGRVRLVSSLPLDAFPPGNYELRVTLSDGHDAETRSATVPILP